MENIEICTQHALRILDTSKLRSKYCETKLNGMYKSENFLFISSSITNS